jgi:hypothetical protein
MSTVADVLAELAALGTEQNRKVMARHGAPAGHLGVKVEDLKKIQKRLKKNQALALALYDTGVPDAQYLAGLVAEPARAEEGDLRRWAETATWQMISEYTVPWVASESRFASPLAADWIDSPSEPIASSGWSTWASLVSITPDDRLDLPRLAGLLDRVTREIADAPNRVRYTMNSYIIAVGAYVVALTTPAREAARSIGRVEVDMGGTSCKVPNALESIAKVEEKGSLGKKRKTAAC